MSHFKDSKNEIYWLDDGEDITRWLPSDCVQITDEEAAELRAVKTLASPEQLVQSFTAAIQQRLDNFARTRNYDNILSACTYATSTVAKFKAEGQACVNLRDATWSAAYSILTQVQAGQRPMPASIADIEADLPAAVWPA